MRSTQLLRQLTTISIKKMIPAGNLSTMAFKKIGEKKPEFFSPISSSFRTRFSTFTHRVEEKDFFQNESMVNVYKKIDSLLEKEIAEAKKLNKTLILLAGDQHGKELLSHYKRC